MLNNKVSILLATYNPSPDWFGLLLDSLNEQDYPNYDVVILDDCSPKMTYDELKEIVMNHLNKVPYFIHRNENNLGSNKTFEKLLSLTDSPFVAFSDQDDIWHEDKLSKDMELLKQHNKKMICSDVRIIDGEGKVLSNSITSYKKRFDFHPKEQLRYLLNKNFVIGCTVVMERSLALSATPFFESMVHDHILAICASNQNELIVNDEAMIDYRVHGSNQTSTLVGVKTKEDYYNYKILKYVKSIDEFNMRFPHSQKIIASKEWAHARDDYYHSRKGSFKKLWKLRKFGGKISYFELFVMKNKPLFSLFCHLLRKNFI